MSYLHELTLRLAMGASQFDPTTRRAHGDWLVAHQRPDCGFAGREGDFYPFYTDFALRSLWILDRLHEEVAKPAAEFLRLRMSHRDSIVDLMSLVFGAAILELAAGEIVISDHDSSWRHNIAGLLATMRCSDGGFAKTPEGRAGSTYQTFLSVLCHELIEIPVPDVDAVVGFIDSQRQVDGGYREIRVAKRAGVNPTAAAIGTLKTLGRLDPSDHGDTVEFISEMQTDTGGLTANTRIPFADLLSTCTGLITLVDLAATDAVSLPKMKHYATSMQQTPASDLATHGKSTSGGFVGFELDETADVEYTFYGLATLSLTSWVQTA
ncbi:MAG: prenyltransferase/squalene oxidase repeat-containing protein [Planctomycetota bacterium]